MSGKAFAALLLLSLGCTGLGCGRPMDYSPPHVARIYKASANGVYSLYKPSSSSPITSAILLKRDPVGFKHDRNGRLVAVAAGEEHLLSEGKYQWRFKGFPGLPRSPADPHAKEKLREDLAKFGQAAVIAAIACFAADGLEWAIHAIQGDELTPYQRSKLKSSDSCNYGDVGP